MTERRIRYKPIGTRRKLLLERIKLAIVLSITGCLLIAAETTVLSHIPIPLFGWSSASPSLGLLFCMAVGFLFDEREGGITGLLCGWLSEATGSGHMMLLPLLYLLCGYMSATVGRRRLAHNLPSFAVFSIVGGGMRCLYLIGMEMLSGGGIPPHEWIWRGLVPSWVMTVLFSFVVYGIVWGERRLLEPK